LDTKEKERRKKVLTPKSVLLLHLEPTVTTYQHAAR
jgi:hypothetical protein